MEVHQPSTITDLQVGDHLCCFYTSEAERRAALLPFLRQGLERGEQVLYIAGETCRESIRRCLEDAGVDVAGCLARGQLAFLSIEETYLEEGIFDPARMLARLRDLDERAHASGYPALRLAVEMDWATTAAPGSERLIEYETAVNQCFAVSHSLELCLYDRRRFGAKVLLEALDTHPLVLAGERVYANPGYGAPTSSPSLGTAKGRLNRRLRSLTAGRPKPSRRIRRERLSSELHSLIFEAMPVGIVLSDLRGTILAANAAVLEMSGYGREEFLALHPEDLCADPAERARLQADLQQTGRIRDREARVKRKDGTVFYALLNMDRVERAGEHLLLTSVRDITERRQAEATWRATFDALHEAIWVVDREQRILLANAASGQMLHCPSEELAGRHCWEVVHGTDRPPPNCPCRAAEKSLQHATTEMGIGERDFLVTADPILDTAGRYSGAVHILSDITERKRQDAELRSAHAELERLLAETRRAHQELGESHRRLEVMHRLGLALAQTTDLEVICRIAHEHVSQLIDCPCFGISLYDPATQTLRAAFMLSDGEVLDTARFPPLSLQGVEPVKGRARAIFTRQPEIVTDMPRAPAPGITVVGPAGGEERMPRSALYMPLLVRGETIGLLEVQSYREEAYGEAEVAILAPMAGAIALAIDNARLIAGLQAERALLERRVAERTAELRSANQELEAFVYSASHDLRAPLRALQGFGAVLESRYGEKLDEQGRHYLDRMVNAARRMETLIDDLLRLSRVSRSALTFRPVDLSALARRIAEELQEREPERQVEWTIAEGLTVRGDEHLLGVALENLLGNAWKFTARREVARIELGRTTIGEYRAAGGVVPDELLASSPPDLPLFFVRDNGAGFDMAYAGNLFAPFQRLHSPEEFPGTGIGLTIVRRIINRHGGTIWAEAKPDQGATFYFTIGGTDG